MESDSVTTFRDYDGANKYCVVNTIKTTGWKLGITQNTSVISSKIRNNLVFPLIADIILLVVSIILLNIVVSAVLKPLSELKKFVKEKVIGINNYKTEKSEVKEIGYLIEELEQRVVSTIHKTQDESLHIQSMVSGTNNNVSKMNGNIMEISAIMEETGASVAVQTQSIGNIDNTCKVVTIAIDKLAEKADTISARAEEIIERVEQMVPEVLEDKKRAIKITMDSREKLRIAIEETQVINQLMAN